MQSAVLKYAEWQYTSSSLNSLTLHAEAAHHEKHENGAEYHPGSTCIIISIRVRVTLHVIRAQINTSHLGKGENKLGCAAMQVALTSQKESSREKHSSAWEQLAGSSKHSARSSSLDMATTDRPLGEAA